MEEDLEKWKMKLTYESSLRYCQIRKDEVKRKERDDIKRESKSEWE